MLGGFLIYSIIGCFNKSSYQIWDKHQLTALLLGKGREPIKTQAYNRNNIAAFVNSQCL
jgi:hypothetical protein